jgi:hypothetical protein
LLTVKNGSAATDLDISFAAADIGTLGGVTLGDITNSDGASFQNYYNVAVTADFDVLGTGAHGAGLYALGFVIPEPTPVFLLLLGGIILALAIKRWRPAGGHAKHRERAAHL